MKKIVSMLLCLICILYSKSIDEEWEERVLISRKNLGLSLCIKEFYEKDGLPRDILYAYDAFSSIEMRDVDDIDRFRDFIKENIDFYMPNFKHRGVVKWYFVACLNMYNSKEYEDMIERRGKYAK